jgi:NAD+ kinase
VHSHLADHAYTNDKKSAARLKSPLPDTHDTLAHLVDGRALHTPTGRRPSFADVLTKAAQDDADSDGEGSQTEEGESDEGSSLTRKLAETAVSVREMSKQLGRALVKTNVNSILIITKARDNQLIKLTREMAIWIMTSMKGGRERGVVVYVDAQLKKSKRFDAAGIERDHPQLFKPFFRRFSRRNSSSSLSSELSELKRHGSLKTPRTVPPSPSRSHSDLHDEEGLGQGQLRYWTPAMCTKSPHLFDFVITLGGDGTVLFASWLFQRVVPPILPFALGSLGFLTCFDFSNFRTVLNTVVNQGVRVNLRMRFTCTVFRAVEVPETQRRAMRSGKTGEIYMADLESGDWDAIESGGNIKNRGSSENLDKDREVLCFSTRPVEEFEVINDLVVDRGPSPYVSLLELFGQWRG